jgi:hypothetical protein
MTSRSVSMRSTRPMLGADALVRPLEHLTNLIATNMFATVGA